MFIAMCLILLLIAYNNNESKDKSNESKNNSSLTKTFKQDDGTKVKILDEATKRIKRVGQVNIEQITKTKPDLIIQQKKIKNANKLKKLHQQYRWMQLNLITKKQLKNSAKL
mgnify:CR=1 FL=1